MSAIDVLTKVDTSFRPFLLVASRDTISVSAANWAAMGLTVRIARGRKMRTLKGLFDEFAAVWQFPLYFGENRDAFDDCLADLEGVEPGAGLVVMITEPDQALIEAEPPDLRWLIESFANAASVWSRPVETGEWWDRPATPFHVVLAGSAIAVDEVNARWTNAGAALEEFQ